MGTRADFYVGIGDEAEWLGSIGWDGYPSGIPEIVFDVSCEEEWRNNVLKFLKTRDDATFPKDGWPWPWEDSSLTDFAYTFDKETKKVKASNFGKHFFDPIEDPEDKYDENEPSRILFPNMKSIKKVTLGKRSGLLVFGK